MENGFVDRVHISAKTTHLFARLLVVGLLLLGVHAATASSADAAGTTVVDVVAAPTGDGLWLLFDDGRVEAQGSAVWHGNGSGPAAALSVMPDGGGYWIASRNGRVDSFGSAPALPGVDHLRLSSGIIDMEATPTGRGLWLVGGDGGIFTAGDARFYGSTGGMRLSRPVVGIAATATGRGYWLVGADGGLFTFGDAIFAGSMGGTALDSSVIGIVATPGGGGYMMIGADGGIFTFGRTNFHGSLGGQGRKDIVGVAPLRNGSGYYLAATRGAVFGFGSAGATSSGAPAPTDTESRIEAEIYDRINTDRRLRGLSPLKWDSELAATAESWSATMNASGFRHSNLGAVVAGVSTDHLAYGENIYWGSGPYATAGEAHQSLMDSAGHREAILQTGYTSVGIGVRCINGVLWVTQQFGHPATDGTVDWSGPRNRYPQESFAGEASPSC